MVDVATWSITGFLDISLAIRNNHYLFINSFTYQFNEYFLHTCYAWVTGLSPGDTAREAGTVSPADGAMVWLQDKHQPAKCLHSCTLCWSLWQRSSLMTGYNWEPDCYGLKYVPSNVYVEALILSTSEWNWNLEIGSSQM